MRHPLRSTRVCLILLGASVLWALAGAPILAQEWAALPSCFLRMLRQMPRRMLALLRLWLA